MDRWEVRQREFDLAFAPLQAAILACSVSDIGDDWRSSLLTDLSELRERFSRALRRSRHEAIRQQVMASLTDEQREAFKGWLAT